jgi:hypothetical protein
MEIREPHAFCVQLVEIWCHGNWVAMTSQITIPLIVCNDDDNIWFRDIHGCGFSPPSEHNGPAEAKRSEPEAGKRMAHPPGR